MRSKASRCATWSAATLILLGFTSFALPAAAWNKNQSPKLNYGGGTVCVVFLHGYTKHLNYWYDDPASARNYWKNSAAGTDFVNDVTSRYGSPYFIIAYDGNAQWWNNRAAGYVANKILAASRGEDDGAGNRCPSGSDIWVVAHSMGATIMDFILGNSYSGTPNYNFAGYDYAGVRSVVTNVLSLTGVHRGSELADAACGSGFCGAGGWLTCWGVEQWLRTTNAVTRYMSSPSRSIYLWGSDYNALSSACLNGDDDGVVNLTSQYACSSDPKTYTYWHSVCGNDRKAKSWGFYNFDLATEYHEDIRNSTAKAYYAAPRYQVKHGLWRCSDNNGASYYSCPEADRMKGNRHTGNQLSRALGTP